MQGVFEERARKGRKSDRTRARLMDAAADAFARHGIEAASVNAIAQAAEVSNGTFYNHFRDKDEIAAVVVFGIARELGRRVDDSMRDLDDAAERTSYGTRQIIAVATRIPSWGQVFIRSVWSLPELRREVSTFARADLERGVRDGVFKVEIDDLLVDLFTSMVVMAVSRVLEGESQADLGSRVAELQLRMLGVSPARAKRIAYAPIQLRMDEPAELA
jgi:AcrR family transcriptional regulator